RYANFNNDTSNDARGIVTMPDGGFTPLLFAARNGDVESAQLLLAAGASPNEAAPDGTSALVLAAHSGQPAVALTLLDHGADINDAGSGYTALHAAVLRGNRELVVALLRKGANPNAPLTKGTPVKRFGNDYALDEALAGATPLWLAAKFLEPRIIEA